MMKIDELLVVQYYVRITSFASAAVACLNPSMGNPPQIGQDLQCTNPTLYYHCYFVSGEIDTILSPILLR
jgi:hypothetical protein